MANQKVTWTTLFTTMSDTIQVYSKHICVGLCIIVASGALFFGYQMWITKKAQAAQYDFSTLVTEYELALNEPNPDWDALLEKFDAQYNKHAASVLLPYYWEYKVQILLHQNKKDEALAMLDSMMPKMPHASLIDLYAMQRALIKLDHADEQIRDKGLATLKMLAHDTTNMFRDTAQFYLGRYYWAHNQIDDAREVWQLLVDEQRDEKISPSPWVAQVQEYLTLTVV